ncbi:hypothetical protein WMF26_43565 [Sorangium sp. So ce185]|uniref:hypothetical protein n=1 Tax=Sorangium sp. So ce185 TaxID=3133287 RepID=UPI003F5F17D7
MMTRSMMTPQRMAPLGCLLGALGAAACAPSGKLEVYIDTDMGIPNNVDTVSLMVSVSGSVKYHNSFSVSSTNELYPRLVIPGSIVFDAPEPDPLEPVTVEVSAWSGGEDGEILGYNKRVVTVPEHESSTTFVPLEFLCATKALKRKDVIFKFGKSACSDQETDQACAFSTCLPVDVLSEIADYDAAKGALDCFDVHKCFDASHTPTDRIDIPAEGEPCVFQLKGDSSLRESLLGKKFSDINVAIQMKDKESGGRWGICDERDRNCRVAPIIPEFIHKEIKGREITDSVTLPEDVCAELRKYKDDVLGVLFAHATPECPHRTQQRPLCRSQLD